MPRLNLTQRFIGGGLIFPIELTPKGSTQLYTGWPLIKSSIFNILCWLIGTRFFLGEYGSRLEELLAEPSDQILQNLLTTFVKDGIAEWEKRVEVLDVQILYTDEHRSKWSVQVILQSRLDQTTDTMVWPFYQSINN